MGIVYFLRAEDKDLFKVGITRNEIWRRIASIQTGCPYELQLYGRIDLPTFQSVERAIHEEWKDRRRRGEWFAVTPDEVNEMLTRHGGQIVPRVVHLTTDRAEYVYDRDAAKLYIRMIDIRRRVSDFYAMTLMATGKVISVNGELYADFDLLIDDLKGDTEMVEWRDKLIHDAVVFEMGN
jgi:hypothetical protein